MAEIAIIGAGPAGSSAGYHLARSGHQVTLIDRASFPRDKVCADGVNLGALRALAAMEIYPNTLYQQAAEFLPIHEFALGVSNGPTYQGRASLNAFCVPRFVLDHLLYRKAIDAGCASLTAGVSQAELEQFCQDFDQVIDARGVSGGVVNAYAIRAYWSVPLERYLPYGHHRIHIYFSRELGVNGYGWIFPVAVADDIVKLNVGVIVFKADYLQSTQNIIRLLGQFSAQNAIAHELGSYLVEKPSVKAYPLAVGQIDQRVSQGRLLKIGEAANLTDPLNGEGIGSAVLSGKAVADAINMSASPEMAAENWQRLYDLRFRPHIEAGLRLRRLRRWWWMNPALIRLMRAYPKLADRVGGSAIAGLIDYSQLGLKPLPSLFQPIL